MLGPALILLGRLSFVAVIVAGASLPADGHLRQVGGSLVALVARADGIVLAEAIEATRDLPSRKDESTETAPVAETRFRRVESIAGEAPDGAFRLPAERQPQRYASGQRAILFLARTSDGWQALQPAGAGLVIARSLDPGDAAVLVELWSARNGTQDTRARVLRRALRSRIAKIRLWAALDLTELIAHGAPLAEGTLAALREDAADPGLDSVTRTALAPALGHRLPHDTASREPGYE